MSEDESKEFREIEDPSVESEEDAYCFAYVDGDGEVVSPFFSEDGKAVGQTDQRDLTERIQSDFDEINTALTSKLYDGSRQTRQEVGHSSITSGITSEDIIEPPYPPKCLANFLEVDPVFFRAVKAKTLDSVGRQLLYRSTLPISPDGAELKEDMEMPRGTISQDDYDRDKSRIERFIKTCNDIVGFRGVLERAAMDYEGIGWAAIEVIRDKAGRVKKLEHVPAQRVRVLKGFKGIVEIVSEGGPQNNGYHYYQLFGEKFKVRDELQDVVVYDPYEHGDLDNLKDGFEIVENFVDYESGEETADFNRSANEILYIPKHHSSTVYYGYSDILPALGAVIGNVYIRDYILQFFEHNTIPRYAVIIKGAKVDDEFKRTITSYFQTQVKGQAHKTLVLSIANSTNGGKPIEFEFKPLDTSRKEADFLETRKENANLIMVAMGTSPAILGIAETANLGSGKGLSQAEIYKDRVVTPCQMYWADKLNILFSRGLGVKFAEVGFDPLDIRDMMLEMQYYTGMQAMGNVSINEVRKDANLGEPIPGGDTHYVRIKDGSAFKVEDLPELEYKPEGEPEPAGPAVQNTDEEDQEDPSSDTNSEE